MNDSLTPEETELDAHLRSEVTQLRSELAGVAVPEFIPSQQSRLPLIAMAAVLMALALGGWFVIRDSSTLIDTSPATEPDRPDAGTVPDEGSETIGATVGDIDPATLAPFNTSTDELAIEELALPSLGETVVDPTFGAPITRITTAGEGQFITPQSPTAFNANETRAILYLSGTEGSRHLLVELDGSNSATTLDINPADIEQVYWSRTNPDELHYLEADTANFTTLNVVSGEKTAEQLDDCNVLSSGQLPVPPSADGKTWGLVCSDGTATGLVNFSPELGEAISTKVSDELDGILPTLSGEYFLHLADNGSAIVLDTKLVETGVTLQVDNNDFVAATDGQGRDVIITALFADIPGTAVRFDLETGEATVLIGEAAGYPYPPTGTKHSTALVDGVSAHKTQGSTFSNGTPRVGDVTLLAGELVIVDSRGSQTNVHRLAHHRDSGKIPIWGKTFISLSPSGTKLLFSSDWFRGDRVDTFIIDLEN